MWLERLELIPSSSSLRGAAYVTPRSSASSPTRGSDPARCSRSPGATSASNLRQWFALLIAEGRSVVVTAQLGHAPSMTLDTYGHAIAKLAGKPSRPAADLIARERRVRDRRARAGTQGRVLTESGRFHASNGGRACPPEPRLTSPLCTRSQYSAPAANAIVYRRRATCGRRGPPHRPWSCGRGPVGSLRHLRNVIRACG
jgi:hypothetical protein